MLISFQPILENLVIATIAGTGGVWRSILLSLSTLFPSTSERAVYRAPVPVSRRNYRRICERLKVSMIRKLNPSDKCNRYTFNGSNMYKNSIINWSSSVEYETDKGEQFSSNKHRFSAINRNLYNSSGSWIVQEYDNDKSSLKSRWMRYYEIRIPWYRTNGRNGFSWTRRVPNCGKRVVK